MAIRPGNHVTPDDRAPAINIITWLALVIICLTSLSKIFSKLWDTRALFVPENFTIAAAMLSAVAQTITVSLQVKAGLGRRFERLSDEQVLAFQKTEYVSQILYIAVVFFAKLTTLFLLKQLASTKTRKLLVAGSFLAIGLWVAVALLGVVFQCPTPHTWEILSARCFNQPAFWAAIAAFDIVTDLVLAVVPIIILWELQVPAKKKYSVMGAFVLRILLIPAIIARVAYFTSARHSADHSFDEFNYVLTTQVGLSLTIMMTCFPFLRMFMDHVHNGFFTGDLRQGPGPNVLNRTVDKPYGSISIISNLKNSRIQQNSGKDSSTSRSSSSFGRSKGGKRDPVGSIGNMIAVIGEENNSIRSSSGSEQMIIKQTKTVTVERNGMELDDLESRSRVGV